MYLKVEMAAVVDAGNQFVQALYNLEGNGPLVLYCYDQIEASPHAIQVHYFPNTAAVIRELLILHRSWKLMLKAVSILDSFPGARDEGESAGYTLFAHAFS